jgi:hypothetical protein
MALLLLNVTKECCVIPKISFRALAALFVEILPLQLPWNEALLVV